MPPGLRPYLCIQNPGAKDAAVTITYMKGDGTTDTQELTVGKNSRSTVVGQGHARRGRRRRPRLLVPRSSAPTGRR